jgi:hypothetical protein
MVYILAAGQVRDGGFDVFDTLGRIFEGSRFTLGFTLICSV